MQNQEQVSDVTPSLEALTTRPKDRPYDPPEELARLQQDGPLVRTVDQQGNVFWLVTSRSLVRAVLADSRFSARIELMNLPNVALPEGVRPPAAQPGDFTSVDPPEHTRYRRLLTGKFTVRRMRLLAERVEQITSEQLDAMERHGSPVDLVEAFAQPIPALVICELLGVPYDRRDQFQQHAMTLVSGNPAEVDHVPAYTALQEFLLELVLAKRAEPTDDLLCDLVNSTEDELTDDELANIGVTLLSAGLDTTANMLALGTLALLNHPDQLAALRADPSLADQAVEELLRYLSIVPFSMRAALEDVEVDGQLIRAGDNVVLSLQTGNRDSEKFADPDTLDLCRQTAGHVAFGHGIHQCLGQQLARVEMRVAFPALFARFPTLRLHDPSEDPAVRAGALIAGLQTLTVSWDKP